MTDIKDLLNIISDFQCKDGNKEIIFPGILQEENGDIILNAKFPIKQYRNKFSDVDFVILGDVDGKKITLLGCNIRLASCSLGKDSVSIFAVPSEIIVGGCFYSIPTVKRIMVHTPVLNYMFSGSSPLIPNVDFSKENPSLLNYAFKKPITAKDRYGEMMIYQTFGFHGTINNYIHNIISAIEYSFDNAMPLMEAFAKVTAAISLFSFFGNGFIPFGEITFNIDADEEEYGLWLNYTEDVPVVNEPFLIDTSVFENNFSEIWKSWLEIFESASPIPTLFYEIVCNRSTRVNEFLNLSQAIEVYSNAFRNKQAKEIAKNDPDNKSKNKEIKLIHRYQDILKEYNGALELIEPNIVDYAKGFSNMRNYYTHYNSSKYVEPAYDELFAASHILRFILLAIVYTAIGIPIDCILECKKRIVFSRFDDFTAVIMNYAKKKK